MTHNRSLACLVVCIVLIAFCEGHIDTDLDEFETLQNFENDLDYLFGPIEASDGERDEQEYGFDFIEEPDLIEYDGDKGNADSFDLDEDYDDDDLKVRSDSTDTVSSKSQSGSSNRFNINIRMPAVNISHDDTYLCTTVKLSKYDARDTIYLIEYIPHAIQSVAHHMLLYGCKEPGSTTLSVWDCGGAMHGGKKGSFVQAPTCTGKETILWAWAKDAPAFYLPKDVGFQVGALTDVKYLTLQVHFKSMAAADTYGIHKISVTAVATIQPQPKVAGIYVLASSDGSIPKHSKKDLDIVCKYHGNVVMHPFAFRTHAHALGKMIYGYVVKNGVWTLIGEKNPQKPEAFYPVTDKNIRIRNGDWLAARCVMESKRNRTTYIGAKHTDEMCNFYFMYWTFRSAVHKSGNKNSCDNGYSWVHWSNYFNHVPLTV